MVERNIKKLVRGQFEVNGAGVKMLKVLSQNTAEAFDPFLMLDSFDSTDTKEYIAGFPFHPHRGIETMTYIIHGEVSCKDSAGNVNTLRSGQGQWVTAGSGVLHQEMPAAAEKLTGLQLWLNMPSMKKMVAPQTLAMNESNIGQVETVQGVVRVLAGQFQDIKGLETQNVQADIYDVTLHKGQSLRLPTKAGNTVGVYLIQGDAILGHQLIDQKTAVLFDDGDVLTVSATANQELRFLFFSAKPLQESVAWGGTVVMNTQEEVHEAFEELSNGNFIKHKDNYTLNQIAGH